MGKFLLVLIFIAVLTSSISANKGSYCKKDESGEFKICGYADTITFINETNNGDSILTLNVDNFSVITPYTFRFGHLHTLCFSSSSLNDCTPKIVDLTPESFDGLSLDELILQCVDFAVKPNPFKNFNVTSLTLGRVELTGNTSEFFADFPFLNSLELSDLNITTISPDIFSGINENLLTLSIIDAIDVVEPKSFERFHNLQTLKLHKGQLVQLRSDMFEGLSELKYLYLYGNKITALRGRPFSKLPRLENLDLSGNKIREIASEAFSDLKNLRNFKMRNNHLENLPVGAFHNLRNLNSLNLGRNKIRTVPYNVFQGCVGLRSIFMDYNAIHHIEPPAFWGLNLSVLDLSYNNLTVLQHDAFIGLRVDYLLDLTSSNISEIEPQAFRNLTAGSLSLCFNNITENDRDSWGADESIRTIDCRW